jgi:predicted signal transduction protein with EAL and GGDEF domain
VFLFHEERLIEEINRVARHKTSLSVILLDIDSFRLYNDTHGHPAGDGVLRKVGGFFVKARANAIWLPATAARGMPSSFRKRTGKRRWSMPNESGRRWQAVPGRSVRSPLHAGAPPSIRQIPAAGLIARADRALYASKNPGRNRVSAL